MYSSPPGLCAMCRHARKIQTATTIFLLCERSRDEPSRYRRYPPLPVLMCPGYEPEL